MLRAFLKLLSQPESDSDWCTAVRLVTVQPENGLKSLGSVSCLAIPAIQQRLESPSLGPDSQVPRAAIRLLQALAQHNQRHWRGKNVLDLALTLLAHLQPAQSSWPRPKWSVFSSSWNLAVANALQVLIHCNNAELDNAQEDRCLQTDVIQRELVKRKSFQKTAQLCLGGSGCDLNAVLSNEEGKVKLVRGNSKANFMQTCDNIGISVHTGTPAWRLTGKARCTKGGAQRNFSFDLGEVFDCQVKSSQARYSSRSWQTIERLWSSHQD